MLKYGEAASPTRGGLVTELCSDLNVAVSSAETSAEPEASGLVDSIIEAVSQGDGGAGPLERIAHLYPSLGLAMLAADVSPTAAFAISRFLQSVRGDLPDWLYKTVLRSIGKLPTTSDGLPFDPEPPTKVPWAELPKPGMIDYENGNTLEDPTITFGDGHAALVLEAVAAMAEQGEPVIASDATVQLYANNLSNSLPRARLLARACLALKISPSDIHFGGVPLSRWTLERGALDWVFGFRHGIPNDDPPPDAFLDASPRLSPACDELRVWLKSGDPRWMRVDRRAFADLKEQLRIWEDGPRDDLMRCLESLPDSMSKEEYRAALNALYHAQPLINQLRIDKAFFRRVPDALLVDPSFADLLALVRGAVCPNLGPDSSRLRNGKKLSTDPRFCAADVRREQRVRGATAALSTVRRHGTPPQPLSWSTSFDTSAFGDPEMLTWGDNAIYFSQFECCCPSFRSLVEQYAQQPRARVFNFLARVLERSAPRRTGVNAMSRALDFLAEPIRVPRLDPRALEALARLADAAGVPLGRVKVRFKKDVLTLSELPGFAGRDRTTRAASAIRGIRNKRGFDSPTQMRRALAGLFPLEKQVLELDEILRACEEARRDGARPFEPMDLSPFDRDERFALLAETVARFHHVGAVAVLAGSIFRGFDAEDVERVLRRLGYGAMTAASFGASAAALAKLEGASREFALREIVVGKPDFALLQTQISFAKSGMTESELERAAVAAMEVDSLCAVRALLDRLTMLGDPPLPTLKVIRDLVDSKRLWRGEVRAAIDGHPLSEQIAVEFVEAMRMISRRMGRADHDLKRVLEVLSIFVPEELLIEASLVELHDEERAQRPQVADCPASDSALLGLARAFHDGLVSDETLTAVRDSLSSERVEAWVAQTKNKDARDALRGLPARPKSIGRQFVAPQASRDVPALGIRWIVSGLVAPADKVEQAAAQVTRGHVAPARPEER
jgi:hypothetical protein